MRPLVVAVVIACSVAAATAAPQGSGPTAAGTVRVDVLAGDKNARPVTDLTVADFEILSDGAVVPIVAFSAARSPLSVVVLVDITASLWPLPEGVAGIPSTAQPEHTSLSLMTTHAAGLIPLAVPEFSLKGLDSRDRVRVGAITRKPALSPVVSGASTDLRKHWKALFEQPPIEWLGPSPIFDAVSDGVLWCAPEPGHRAVILMSDGRASGNVRGHAEVATDAVLAGVSINTIVDASVAPALGAMADATGGWHFANPYSQFSNRTEPIERMLDLLHRSYTLGFTPVPDGKPHALEVRVKKPGVIVRARRGYVTRSSSGS